MRPHRHIAEAGAEQTASVRPHRPPHPTTSTAPAVPVVLPHIALTVHDDGTMKVTVDGQPYEPEPSAPPWRREDFAHILDQLTDQRSSPARVEVRETDGAVFTDIITPGKRHQPSSEAEPAAPAEVVPEQLALHGEGFMPGENVAVAIVVAHCNAAPDGTAQGLLTPGQLAASPTREVVLLGRLSGAYTVGQPA